jgi:hypothetical protein
MERNFVQSETIINEHPPYACLWIPKAHWLLHMAHDIFLYGPTRLLATYLNEMKNAKFKAGAKRGNFHNPAKDVAVFWAGQSDWELRSMPVSRNICCSESATVLVSGVASRSLLNAFLSRFCCSTPMLRAAMLSSSYPMFSSTVSSSAKMTTCLCSRQCI